MGERLSLWKKLVSELVFMGLTREEFRRVQPPVAEDNRKSVAAWSVVAGLFWIMSLILSMNYEDFHDCRTVYTVALALNFLTMLGALFLVKRVPWTLIPILYLFEATLLGAAIGIAVCQPHVRSVTMVAFAILLPTVLVENTLSDIVVHALGVAAYILAGRNTIDPEIYFWGLRVLLIFTVAGFMVGHVINKARYQRYIYAESARELAEIQKKYAYVDQMTELKNRRAYVEKLEELAADMPENLCVVMADLNELKQTNDTKGHDAGDELILGAARCLTSAFEETGTVYRIGGDEFCVLAATAPEKAEGCLKYLEKVTAEWKGEEIDHISLSCGLASNREHNDLEKIVNEADQKMYEAKRLFYQTTRGADRRRR